MGKRGEDKKHALCRGRGGGKKAGQRGLAMPHSTNRGGELEGGEVNRGKQRKSGGRGPKGLGGVLIGFLKGGWGT